MKNIRIATRASKLAIIQAEQVKGLLEKTIPLIKTELVKITTRGDRDKSDFLHKTESVGFFTSEIENALIEDQADVAVHSFKDLPTTSRSGLCIGAILPRRIPNDVIVSGKEINSLDDLPEKAKVGTSSVRRIAQLKNARPDLNCLALRGNVETRLSKIFNGQYDAAVMAHAGLSRLGLADKISFKLPLKEFIPAPAQGAIAVQINEKNDEINEIVKKIDHKNTRITVQAERLVLKAVEGGCSMPLGVYGSIEADKIYLQAVLLSPDGTSALRHSVCGNAADSQKKAAELADKLISEGADILQQVRNYEGASS